MNINALIPVIAVTKKILLFAFFLIIRSIDICATEERKWDGENSIAPTLSIDSADSTEIRSTNSKDSRYSQSTGKVVPVESLAMGNTDTKNEKKGSWLSWPNWSKKKKNSVAPQESPKQKRSKREMRSIEPKPVDQNMIIANQLLQAANLPRASSVKGLAWQTQKVNASILTEQASIENIKERLNTCMNRCVENANRLFSSVRRKEDLKNTCSGSCIRQEQARLAAIKQELEMLVIESEKRFRSNY